MYKMLSGPAHPSEYYLGIYHFDLSIIPDMYCDTERIVWLYKTVAY